MNPVSKFSETIAQVGQAVASSDRIGTIYELPADKKIPAFMPVINITELVIKDLRFSYGSMNENGGQGDLLNGVNMTFSKGEVTGIVGISGKALC